MARPRYLCHTERGSFFSGELRSIFSSGQRRRAHLYLRDTSASECHAFIRRVSRPHKASVTS
eukprot:534453-Prymnesium_polylepis.1